MCRIQIGAGEGEMSDCKGCDADVCTCFKARVRREESSQKAILRRIAERGMKVAQYPPMESTYIDLFQHLLDEIERLP